MQECLIQLPSGESIAYRRLSGSSPGVVFLGGFMSDMSGRKSLALWNHCRERGRAFVCFDYRGHGRSSGELTSYGFDSWLEDSLWVLDAFCVGTQVLVGSSMGAWIMTRCLELRRARVAAVIGLGAAPDFTTDALARLNAAQAAALESDGFCELPTAYAEQPYRLTRRLIDSSRQHGVLSRVIEFDGPVRLFHGLADADVPWSRSLALAEAIRSPDLEVRLVAGGDHRLSSERDLASLRAAVDEIFGILTRTPT